MTGRLFFVPLVAAVLTAGCRHQPPTATVSPGLAFDTAEIRFLALCIDDALVMRTDHQELEPHDGVATRDIVVTPGAHHLNVVVRTVSSARATLGYTLLIRSAHDVDTASSHEVKMELYERDGAAFQDRAAVRWKL